MTQFRPSVAMRIVAVFALMLAAAVLCACGGRNDTSESADPLAGLIAAERDAVLQMLGESGLSIAQLRPVGKLGIAKNSNAVAVANGHVVGLRLSGSNLKSLRPVAALPELALLWAPENRIASLDGLENARKLTELMLSGNQISSVHGLAGVSSLEVVSLANNRLASLQDLPALPALHTLDVSGNQLRSLEGVASLGKLWTVRARGNPLEDAEAARALRTRGGEIELPETVAAVAHGVNAPRPAGESPSHFVLTLPETAGAKTGQENFGAPRTGQRFDYSGRMRSLAGTQRLGLLEGGHASADPVTVELRVTQGRVRLYLADLNGFRYAEASLQQPLRLSGRLMTGLNQYAVVSAVDGEATGLEWRVFRN